MATEHVIDQVARALARLPQQHRGKVNTEALLSALAGPAQELEDALYQLLTERDIDTAIGTQLDDLGLIVGEARQGRDDDTYRRFVRARISVNRSKGTVLDVLTVASLVLDLAFDEATYELDQSGTAAYVLRVTGTDISRELATLLTERFLRLTHAAGVRGSLRFSPDDANRARWGTATYESTDVWGGASS